MITYMVLHSFPHTVWGLQLLNEKTSDLAEALAQEKKSRELFGRDMQLAVNGRLESIKV